MSTNAERLAQRVRARRDELDLSQLDVWQAGGPSNTTLTEIENGRTERLTRTTARKLDVGLQWEPGSAKRVWEGGDPAPLGKPASRLDALRQQVADNPDLSPRTRAEILAALERNDDPPAVGQGEVKGA